MRVKDLFVYLNFVIMQCPICKKDEFTQTVQTVNVEHFGEVLIITQKCANCGYKHIDVFPAEIRDPCEYELKVETKEELYAKVIRSSSGEVEIPELGLKITPGPAAQGFITNVEGILLRFENVLEGQLVVEKDEKKREKIKEILNKIEKAKEGRMKFTIKVRDPYGNSAIVSEKAKKEKMKY